MKKREVQKVSKDKIGRVIRNDVKTEVSEDSTILYLTQFGFNIELIKPASTKKSHNPDVLILGAVWEIKSPESSNKNTIKVRFRKASKQANKVIFDLRNIKHGAQDAEKQLTNLFKEAGRVRRMMIIRKDGRLFDYIK